jgi:hypothetical protein
LARQGLHELFPRIPGSRVRTIPDKTGVLAPHFAHQSLHVVEADSLRWPSPAFRRSTSSGWRLMSFLTDIAERPSSLAASSAVAHLVAIAITSV